MKKLKIGLVGILAVIFIFCLELGCKKGKGITLPNTEVTWQEVESPTTKDLYSVFTLSEDDAWAVGDSGTIIHWDGSEWSLVESHTISSLRSIYFVSKSNGWASGGSSIIHYEGTKWELQESELEKGLYRISFADENNGWAVADTTPDSLIGSVERIILHTSDGGKNWQILKRILKPLTSIFFLDETIGWAVDNGFGDILYTSNGGIDWESQIDVERFLSDIFFFNQNVGWAVGCRTILYTKDGGIHWEYQIKSGVVWFTSIIFADSWNGLAVGYNDTEGGSNLAQVAYTTNGGKTWYIQSVDIEAELWDVDMFNSNNGWAVGGNGVILRYTFDN